MAIGPSSWLKRYIAVMEVGTIFTTRQLIGLGPRAAIDQCLYRLVKQGRICRLARGVFAKGEEPPRGVSIIELATIKAKAFGKTIYKYGVTTAAELGLIDPPRETVFATNGCSSSFMTLAGRIHFRSVSAKKREFGIDDADVHRKILKALWYLGKGFCTKEVVAHYLERFNNFKGNTVLAEDAATPPQWLVELFPLQPYYADKASRKRHKLPEFVDGSFPGGPGGQAYADFVAARANAQPPNSAAVSRPFVSDALHDLDAPLSDLPLQSILGNELDLTPVELDGREELAGGQFGNDWILSPLFGFDGMPVIAADFGLERPAFTDAYSETDDEFDSDAYSETGDEFDTAAECDTAASQSDTAASQSDTAAADCDTDVSVETHNDTDADRRSDIDTEPASQNSTDADTAETLSPYRQLDSSPVAPLADGNAYESARANLIADPDAGDFTVSEEAAAAYAEKASAGGCCLNCSLHYRGAVADSFAHRMSAPSYGSAVA